ncbi:MAG: autotransporter outer membrane beta-barrel domain-containing protein [Steroidobacteraceae bacterium]|nr:autotransporter outer membrane beta-barrel domain-containing protein [Steroidobacteraceae bacterium]MDW8258842.1 autotransporter outer membrane beta-barrel domain-containing protein [Gammaproteobacteria bacterium]
MVARASVRVAAAAVLGVSGAAEAANPTYQAFFFAVCQGAPTGALAARCAETPLGLGDLSGDSESSLNPSQSLARNQSALAGGSARSTAVREQGERLRDKDRDGAVRVDRGPWSFLASVSFSEIDRQPEDVVVGERRFTGDNQSFELGVDYRLSDRLVLGGLLGVERSELRFAAEAVGRNFTPASRAGDHDVDSQYLTLLGQFTLGDAGFIEWSAGFEKNDGRYRRFSVFQESTRTRPQTNVAAEGDTDGSVWWVSVNAGLDFARGRWSVGPYGGLTRLRAEFDGYDERDRNGSGLAMRFSSTARTALPAHVGVRASYTSSGARGVWIPQLRVEYRADLDEDSETVRASFLLDPRANQLALDAPSWDRNGVVAGASVSAILPNGWMWFLDYSALLGYENIDRQRATLGLRYEF